MKFEIYENEQTANELVKTENKNEKNEKRKENSNDWTNIENISKCRPFQRHTISKWKHEKKKILNGIKKKKKAKKRYLRKNAVDTYPKTHFNWREFLKQK